MIGRYELADRGHGVGAIRICTDDAPHVRPDDVRALRALAAELDGASAVRALVLEGGERHFSAGATLDTLVDPGAAERIHALVGEAARLLLSIPVPTVAAMAGHALGGGLMYGLWCDSAFLAREALYGANFVDLGFTPGMGSTALLAEVVGPTLARELLLTGRVVTGAELAALAPGFAHAVVPRAEVRDRAYALAEELARPPSAAVRLAKAQLTVRRRAMLDEALRDERTMHHLVFERPDTRDHIAQNYARKA